MSKQEKHLSDAAEAFDRLDKALFHIPMDALRFEKIESAMQSLKEQLKKLEEDYQG